MEYKTQVKAQIQSIPHSIYFGESFTMLLTQEISMTFLLLLLRHIPYSVLMQLAFLDTHNYSICPITLDKPSLLFYCEA